MLMRQWIKEKEISFARVLVEMSLENKFGTTIEEEFDDGVVFTQEVVYDNTPRWCDNFAYFGHLVNQWPMTKVWKVKEITNE